MAWLLVLSTLKGPVSRMREMVEQNHVLIGAIRKLALAGEQAEFSVEQMIELLERA